MIMGFEGSGVIGPYRVIRVRVPGLRVFWAI